MACHVLSAAIRYSRYRLLPPARTWCLRQVLLFVPVGRETPAGVEVREQGVGEFGDDLLTSGDPIIKVPPRGVMVGLIGGPAQLGA